jgi:hypothetical protein
MLPILSALIGPVMTVISELVPDDDKKREIRSALMEKMLDKDSDLVKAQASIITAEAQGEGFLQKAWRPITMLSFLVLLFTYWLGFAPPYVVDNPDLVTELFSLLKIGIGGYIGSRGVEKVATTVANAGGIKKMLAG